MYGPGNINGRGALTNVDYRQDLDAEAERIGPIGRSGTKDTALGLGGITSGMHHQQIASTSIKPGKIGGLTFVRFGLIGGVIVGLNRGGSAVIKHYALRLSLWLKGYTPFRFVRFLDQCAS